ncbi:hypothetical protein ACIGXM_03470 [Kitasatospora sp. NPDC052896]|uniref:hypothetical protein n=1 Tax=Kitasatospora sp. NPDC052896 TaxID=3364061 RepID=UPI0037C82358
MIGYSLLLLLDVDLNLDMCVLYRLHHHLLTCVGLTLAASGLAGVATRGAVVVPHKVVTVLPLIRLAAVIVVVGSTRHSDVVTLIRLAAVIVVVGFARHSDVVTLVELAAVVVVVGFARHSDVVTLVELAAVVTGPGPVAGTIRRGLRLGRCGPLRLSARAHRSRS